jgi:hypothetical protein
MAGVSVAAPTVFAKVKSKQQEKSANEEAENAADPGFTVMRSLRQNESPESAEATGQPDQVQGDDCPLKSILPVHIFISFRRPFGRHRLRHSRSVFVTVGEQFFQEADGVSA